MLVYLQFVVWRSEAIHRLGEMSESKRTGSEAFTPSPHQRKKKTLEEEDAASAQGTDHSYSTAHTSSEDVSTSDSVQQRVFKSRRKLQVDTSDSGTHDPHADFLMDIKENSLSVEHLIDTILCYSPARQMIEHSLLVEMDSQMYSLTSGSIMAIRNNDTRIRNVAKLAVEECRERVPFLHKILAMASSSSSTCNNYYCIFIIYGILMRCRSQRQNILQRLITAACIRYNAGNKVNSVTFQHKVNSVTFQHRPIDL